MSRAFGARIPRNEDARLLTGRAQFVDDVRLEALDGKLRELHALRRENVQLRMERDILKKATAFFARESK